MGFWDSVKRFFGGGGGPPGTLGERLLAMLTERLRTGRMFRAQDLAEDLAASEGRVAPSADELAAAVRVAAEAWRAGTIGEAGYERTFFAAPAEVHVYHPVGADADGYMALLSDGAEVVRGATTTQAARADDEDDEDDEDDGDDDAPPPPARGARAASAPPAPLKTMAAAAVRVALLAVPRPSWWSQFLDRRGIPSGADRQVALIERMLVLRGYLSEGELAEAHRIGDLWLRFRDRATYAARAGAVAGRAAVEQLRAERAARKQAKQAAAAARAEAERARVAANRAGDIIFAGAGVSGGLGDRRAHLEKLAANQQPPLATPADLARALGVAVPRLRWLAWAAAASEVTHYVHFEIPKKSGGTRILSAPKPALLAAQTWILRQLLDALPVDEAAHGFVRGRSIVSNARAHVGSDVVVNLDLADFFPSITFARVRGAFVSLGYAPAVATLLALLCTTEPCRAVEYDGKRLWVAVGERALPQGAPTSPALSNLIARRLDRRLRGMARKHGWRYTRYADDLSFSAPPARRGDVAMLLARVRHIVGEEGFRLNAKKQRVQRAAGRQSVTGLVVNDKVALPRRERRRLRAILHHAKTEGLAAQNRAAHPDFPAWLDGMLAYANMVDPAAAAPLKAARAALKR